MVVEGFGCLKGVLRGCIERDSRRVSLGIQKPTVLRVRPSNEGLITCHFVGFGGTGRVSDEPLEGS